MGGGEQDSRGGDTYTLGIGRRLAVDLVPAQYHQIRLVLIQPFPDKLQRPRIGVAFASVVSRRFGISTHPQSRAQMQIRHLHDSEFAILADPRNRLVVFTRRPSPDAQPGLLLLARRVQKERGILDLPLLPRLDGIRPKENIDRGDGVVGVAGPTLIGSLEPDAGRPRLPSFLAFTLGGSHGILSGHADIQDDLILWEKFDLLLPLHVDEGVGDPSTVQVEVFLDAMPELGVELATREEGERGAGGHGDVGDDQTGVMEGQVVMDRLRQNAETIVEDEDEEDGDDDEHRQLRAGANLEGDSGKRGSDQGSLWEENMRECYIRFYGSYL